MLFLHYKTGIKLKITNIPKRDMKIKKSQKKKTETKTNNN